jgi:mitochondrial fission protein ELM1
MPVVWLIDAYRAGERAQVMALVKALGWSVEVKSLSYRKYEFLTNVFRGSDLRGIKRDQSSPLRAPWPELVISSGLRNEPVCRWIRDQSSGKTKIVHVGRPWADPSRFDLVVTTPQYRIPQRDNVLQNSLTLHQVNAQRLQRERNRWRAQFEHLPTPRTAVCVGGDSGPYTFGPKAAVRLARQANKLAQRHGGSLLVSTSSRTSSTAAQALENALEAPHYFYRWRPGDDANPYFGILGLADQFIVTADSISMLSEACASGRPVFMFDLGSGRHAMQPGNTGADSDNDFRLGGLLYRYLMRWGWQRLSRDISLVHSNLVQSGRAAWSGEMSAAPVSAQPTSDLDAAVAAVRSLFQQGVVDA